MAGTGTVPGDPNRTCSVPPNDPGTQVLQPKPRQVEWAVNRAVEGNLTISRPADWNHSGLPAYTPQGMFPRPALSGGGTVPVQVLLGVLAQESNLWQASRYTNPGQAGNPLVGLFYGNDRYAGYEDSSFWEIDFPEADCGYGVGQITDDMRIGGGLTSTEQRAIAVDYAANVAKAFQMLIDKWNETRAAGLIINDGDEIHPENWFFALWAYNTGFYPEGAPGEPWGVGFTNNPANMDYPPNRGSFLDGSPWDAANPQYWPYPEKVLGFAAHSLDLVQEVTVTSGPFYDYDYVSAFRTAWWSGAPGIAEANRTNVKPPVDLFCEMSVNECDWSHPDSCTRSDWKCWWNEPATWKNCGSTGTPNTQCGFEFVRFDPAIDYMTEQVNGTSLPPNFGASMPPPGSLIIDDRRLDVGGTVTIYSPALGGCSATTSSGKFELNFGAADTGGNHPSKIDFHQLSGGFDSHFYFSHSWGEGAVAPTITGTWTLNQTLNQWARVFVHIPDHAAWSQGARYTIDTGPEQVERTLLQHRYSNQWVPLGVFDFDGVPTVSLSNHESQLGTDSNTGLSWIAWDAVAIQPLAGKPEHFVVALGDSFSSGEGAGSYSLETDNDGHDATQNACHRSENAWVRKAHLGSVNGPTVGDLADALDSSMDFHFLACSGAEARHLLPTSSTVTSPLVDGYGQAPAPQYLMPTQLDQGYLDENTTLVTLSIGGNDIGFSSVITACILADTPPLCSMSMAAYVQDRLDNGLYGSVRSALREIHERAPNAVIDVAGYPKIFSVGTTCLSIPDSEADWLNATSETLNAVLGASVETFASDFGVDAVFGDPTTVFFSHGICSELDPPAFNQLSVTPTPGEDPMIGWPIEFGVSAESVHPNGLGTDLYADVMEDAIDGIYP